MFVLIESFMNGTVTIMVGATGLDFLTFKDAVNKVKNNLSEIDDGDIDFITDDENEFCYRINQEVNCVGIMKNVQMKIINE